jgi:hypothetical protein
MTKADNKVESKKIVSDAPDAPIADDVLAAIPAEAESDELPVWVDGEAVAPPDEPIAEVEAPVVPVAPAVNSMSFGKAKPSNEPVFVTRVIDGVEKKFRIRGLRFHIKGIDYTAEDLAQNTTMIDSFIAKNSGMLEEVFE